MLFRREVLEGIAAGRIDRVFRVWQEPRVRAGSTQRTWAGIIVVDSVTAVTSEEITEKDALQAGFSDRAALLTALSKSTKEGGYHRVMLHLGRSDRKARARLQFDRFDKNGDGLISVSEYRDVMANLGEFPETTVRAIFDKKDANGDGVLAFEEFWDSLNA